MKKPLLILAAAALAIMLVAMTSALTGTGTLISNVYQGQTTVTPSSPVTIGLGGGKDYTCAAESAGTPFALPIDVTNPNKDVVEGIIYLNFSASAGIGLNDVFVCCPNTYYLTDVVKLGVSEGSLMFELDYVSTGAPYYPLWPGLNANVSVLTVQYNTPGNYVFSLAVCQ